MSSIAVHSLLQVQQATPPASTSPPLSFPTASTITLEAKPRPDSLKVGVATQNNACLCQNPAPNVPTVVAFVARVVVFVAAVDFVVVVVAVVVVIFAVVVAAVVAIVAVVVLEVGTVLVAVKAVALVVVEATVVVKENNFDSLIGPQVKVKLKPRPRAVPDCDDSPGPGRHPKRAKGYRWRRWSISIKVSR